MARPRWTPNRTNIKTAHDARSELPGPWPRVCPANVIGFAARGGLMTLGCARFTILDLVELGRLSGEWSVKPPE
jgi:hypothetical protein